MRYQAALRPELIGIGFSPLYRPKRIGQTQNTIVSRKVNIKLYTILYKNKTGIPVESRFKCYLKMLT
ncbi:MAG TPA: hypothetical protein DEO84_05275 [candidate division Zixibacteria bacterium]|nr:hypothetical protein [candidate division Zixibacteria bacterium]